MKFHTESERCKHPQAGLIPRTLWFDLFDTGIYGLEVALMQTSIKTILEDRTHISMMYSNDSTTYHGKIDAAKRISRAWLCIVLAHQEATPEELIQAADLLAVTDSLKLKLALSSGNIPLIISIINQLDSNILYQEFALGFSFNSISNSMSDSFKALIQNGQLQVLETLAKKSPQLLLSLIGHTNKSFDSPSNFPAFIEAVCYGQVAILKFFEQLAPQLIQDMIRSDNFAAYKNAVKHGHLAVIKHLEALAPDLVDEMTQSVQGDVYSSVAERGDLEMLHFIESRSPRLVTQMIRSNQFAACKGAAREGHIAILEHFGKQDPTVLIEFCKSINYKEYLDIAASNRLDILEYLEKLVPGLSSTLLSEADKFFPFGVLSSVLSSSNILGVLQFLESKTPGYIGRVIDANNAYYDSFAEQGNLPVLIFLESKATKSSIENGIRLDTYCTAAKNGHLHVMKHIEGKVSDALLREMIKHEKFSAYYNAARSGHLHIMRHLEAKVPDLVPQMINSVDSNDKPSYQAYMEAARDGHLDVIVHLETMAPNLVIEMIKTNRFCPIAIAAGGEHMHLLKHMEAKVAELGDDLFRLMADRESSCGLATFNDCYKKGNLSVVDFLLSNATYLAYAEMHEAEYKTYTHPFIKQRLMDLKTQRDTLIAEQPNAIFNLTEPNDIHHCFYMIRNIIRRNDRALDDDLRFLLDIPAVKDLAHREVTPGRPNELVRLALTTNHLTAAGLLLNIPAVRDIAEQHNFYREEARGAFDLSAVARDNESSMQALTSGEQKRLDAALKKYQPTLVKESVAQLIRELRKELIKRYDANPATITLHGKKTKLPLTWDEFNQLNLPVEARQQALVAYYQHKDHCALRYLSKPNHWMHAQAEYVNVNPEVLSERWSTFEEYQPLIALMWLAAKDRSEAPVLGQTLPGRIDQFIDELAHIGRAHNWDKKRNKLDAQGKAILDKKGKIVTEEYDDLEADRPSCFSGVKRRLFQSVVGHRLLTILTEDLVKQDLMNLVREHYRKSFKPNHYAAVDTVLESLAEGDNIPKEAFDTLSQLNISMETIDSYIKILTQQFGEQALDFAPYIKKRFELPPDNHTANKRKLHIMAFYSEAHLDVILPQIKLAEEQATSSQAGTAVVQSTAAASGYYEKLTAPHQGGLEKAKALLLDYTKNDYRIGRFLYGHWNRYYVYEVQKIADRINSNEINSISTIKDLLAELKTIDLEKKDGSLTKRIGFIEAHCAPTITSEAHAKPSK